MARQDNSGQLNLHYTILCEDVRLEIGQKLSLIGVFYAIQVPQLPINVLKLVILNHWSGDGQYLSEVRILTPDRTQPVAVSQPSAFEIPQGGYADNVTMFANITFPVAGRPVPDAFYRVLDLLHVVAGVSYYKVGAPARVVAPTAVPAAAAEFFTAFYTDGLAEYA